MKPRNITLKEAESPPLVRQRIPSRRSRPSVRGGKGSKMETSLTINRPAGELFGFWRNFENLPRVMQHVESVKMLGERRSHWRVRRPGEDLIEWVAEVINEHPNELIAWRTLEGSDVHHAGTIRFAQAPGGRGTEVKLTVEYEIVGGKFIATLAKFFRRSPEQQMREDLRHFKQIMEAGEVPTTVGQPAAREADKAEKYEEAK